MSELLDRLTKLSPKRLALLAMQMQARLDALERARAEPIAIIGLGCRFPGADDPQSFWQLLHGGTDAIREVPANRWDVDAYYDTDIDAPGKMTTRWGGFLDSVSGFDASFFGISPREALSMDPQQRLLLEVAWEALEHAGQAPEKLEDSPTGVFLGICNSDYAQMLHDQGQADIDAYMASGSAHSVAAGRLSYILGLHGPNIAVDTACSSSLVAVHLAVQSLRSNECHMALAAGVNLILAPDVTIALSKSRMMAADGRCKTFDAAADGFVRGEGCGVVVLKRLADAQADGDRVLAVIRGSAVNQDGRSNGLTAPNGPAQESIIRAGLANAGVLPNEVDYVEAHGTGTALGDPIEVQALGSVLSAGRTADDPLLLGSVKTNIGHLEAAAGVAGLIKVVLALRAGAIPPHLHLNQPSQHIPWDLYPLAVATSVTPWPTRTRQRIASISSFGFSGTNAYLIVEEAPPVHDADSSETTLERPLHLLPLSARSAPALADVVAQYRDYLAAHPNAALADICATAAGGRSHFNHRLAVPAGTVAQMHERLSALAAGTPPPEIAQGILKSSRAPEIAFLFTGQGAQYAGMARTLYDTQPSFRQALDRCAELLARELDRPLLDVIFASSTVGVNGSASSHLLDQTAYTQPALFAVEYALAELWRSWGITPSAVLGHSVGEYVAACVAGVFSLEDALKLIAARGRLMQQLPAGGVMVALTADPAQVAAAIAPFERQVALAAINGPTSTVIAGAAAAVEAVCATLATQGVKQRPLVVSHAFHSPLMEPMLAAFEQVARTVTYSAPRIPFVSNLTGKLADHEVAEPAYWVRHIRQPVQFASGMQALHEQGCTLFVEIGPHPVLLGMGRQCLPENDSAWLPSLRQGRADWDQLLESLGTLYTHGAPIDWDGFERDYPRQHVALPTYPFQRERYWIERRPQRAVLDAGDDCGHPLLGRRLHTAAIKEILFESRISLDSLTFLDDHRIFGTVILPSPAYMELALAAAAQVGGPGDYALEGLALHEAMIIPDTGERLIQLVLHPQGERIWSFQVWSRDQERATWVQHADGKLSARQAAANLPPESSLAAIRSRCTESVDVAEYYAQMGALDLRFGPRFQGIRELWRGQDEALARMQLPDALHAEASAYQLHPALLDACLHILGAALTHDTTLTTPYLLVGLDRLSFYTQPGETFWSHATIRPSLGSQDAFTADMRLLNANGELVASLEGLALKQATPRTLLRSTRSQVDQWLYEIVWRAAGEIGQQSGSIAAPTTIGRELRSTIPTLEARFGTASYRELLPQLDAACGGYILRALDALGWHWQPGSRVEAGALMAQLRIEPRHRRLVDRMLAMLTEDGLLAVDGSAWIVAQVPSVADPETLMASLLNQYPAHRAELEITRRCARGLAAVLRGEADPLQLLFPGGSTETAEDLYQRSPSSQLYNTLMSAAVTEAISQLPHGRPIRILEIGGGTGGTSAYILPTLPAERSSYVFTDISPLFTNKARQKFQEFPFVQYRALDISKEPTAQGFESHSFDLILAANVLHATPDMRQTLRHAQSLLASDGLLLMMEGTTPQRFGDLTVGLTDGWWSFSDTDLRPEYALMDQAHWRQALTETGFAETTFVPEAAQATGILAQQAVILARGPQRAQPTQETTHSIDNQDGWLIFADRSRIGHELAERLESTGGVCSLVVPGQGYAQIDAHTYAVNPAQPDDFRKLLRDLSRNEQPLRSVIHLWSLDAPLPETMTLAGLRNSQEHGLASTLHLAQALLAEPQAATMDLWVVTRGAQPVEPVAALAVAQTPVSGLVNVLALEHPELRCRQIDLDPTNADPAAQLISEFAQPANAENQIALRGQTRYVRRLVPSGAAPVIAPELSFRSDATYLITGGLGGLGLLVAEWMVGKDARHLVLMGRSAPGSEARTAITRMEQVGAQITLAQGDVAQHDQVARILSQIDQRGMALAGIIHAAGALDDGVVQQQNWERFTRVLAAKVDGAWNLHTLTRERSLDWFVLFSSGASLLGTRGQSNHAAANAFEDALAHHRRAQGLPAQSINWGPWSEVGAVVKQQVGTRIATQGMDFIAPERGLEALGQIMRRDEAQIAVLRANWPQLWQQLHLDTVPALIADLVSKPTSAQPTVVAATREPSLTERLAEALPVQRRGIVMAYVRAQAARLRLDPVQIDPQQPLNEMGFDSLMSVELRNTLGVAAGRTLPATLIFEYPSVDAIAGYLSRELLPADTQSVAAPVAPASAITTTEMDDLSEDELADLLAKKLVKLR